MTDDTLRSVLISDGSCVVAPCANYKMAQLKGYNGWSMKKRRGPWCNIEAFELGCSPLRQRISDPWCQLMIFPMHRVHHLITDHCRHQSWATGAQWGHSSPGIDVTEEMKLESRGHNGAPGHALSLSAPGSWPLITHRMSRSRVSGNTQGSSLHCGKLRRTNHTFNSGASIFSYVEVLGLHV